MITLSEALSNFSGTTNYVAKYTPTGNVLGISQIFDNGTNVGIGTASPTSKLQIVGTDSTSSNYSLKIDNSASSPLLYVRNDGITKISTNQNNDSVLVLNDLISFLTYSQTNMQMYFGATFESGYTIAKSTISSAIISFSDQLRFCGKTSLTIGNSFSYDTLMNLNLSTGNLSIGYATASVSDSKFAVNGTIKTAAPSSNGTGLWKLGKKVTATVSLVTTDYIEVEIDSVVYKLALVN